MACVNNTILTIDNAKPMLLVMVNTLPTRWAGVCLAVRVEN